MRTDVAHVPVAASTASFSSSPLMAPPPLGAVTAGSRSAACPGRSVIPFGAWPLAGCLAGEGRAVGSAPGNDRGNDIAAPRSAEITPDTEELLKVSYRRRDPRRQPSRR